jgi:hypothetical protein
MIILNFVWEIVQEFFNEYFILNKIIKYSEFTELMDEDKIERIIINKAKLNKFKKSESGLLFGEIRIKNEKESKFLSLVNVNTFIENLENYQIDDLQRDSSDMVRIEFARPYKGMSVISMPINQKNSGINCIT